MYYESHLYDGFLLLHKTWIFQVMFIRAVLIKNFTVTDKLNQLQNNSLQKVNPTTTYSVLDSYLLHNRQSYKETQGKRIDKFAPLEAALKEISAKFEL
ncbi:MAG: hypothetical protein KAQ79_07595 [Cyclobacteriaceae bacterium]|nr:hypothetical protein [Cyclobacteriaceae bacterium]